MTGSACYRVSSMANRLYFTGFLGFVLQENSTFDPGEKNLNHLQRIKEINGLVKDCTAVSDLNLTVSRITMPAPIVLTKQVNFWRVWP